MARTGRLILVGVLIILALILGLTAIGLRQLADPASYVSGKFTIWAVDKCIAASQHGAEAEPADAESAGDSAVDICRCGADDFREDLADAGLDGLAHMLFLEGIDAKMQRVMNGCQSIPSAP